MADTIPTIDAWNARLAPPLVVDSNASDSQWAEDGDCGCCMMPKCCPPQLQCQSGFSTIGFVGFTDPGISDSNSDGITDKFLRHVTRTEENSYTETSNYPYPDDATTYTSLSVTSTAYEQTVMSYATALHASISGAFFAAACFIEANPEVMTCEFGGTRTETHTGLSREDGVWVEYVLQEVSKVVSSAEGDETTDHIQWELDAAQWDIDHPDYATEHAAWVTAHAEWVTAHAAWVIEYQAWEDAGGVGDPPEEPIEPVEPPPRPVEPDEFYGPCWWKTVTTTTNYERYWTGSAWATRAIAGTEEFPNPSTVTSYGFTGSPLEGPTTGPTVSYENRVTHAEFLAQAEAWTAANRHRIFDAADTSGESAGCEPGDLCYASRSDGSPTTAYQEIFFRYRWKLNKCCGLYAGLAWLEVYYPKEFIDWLAAELASSGHTDPPVIPTTTNKAWEWEGLTRPTECNNSNSSDSVIGPNDPGWNAFDDETRWSPWSLTVSVPSGEMGRVHLRNLYMSCYRSIYGTKPDLIPLYGTYDPSDLDGDGIKDSQQ